MYSTSVFNLTMRINVLRGLSGRVRICESPFELHLVFYKFLACSFHSRNLHVNQAYVSANISASTRSMFIKFYGCLIEVLKNVYAKCPSRS